MNSLLLPLLLLSASAPSAPITFHYTNDQFLAAQRTTPEAWFEQCAAGGEFADFARDFAPDPRISREERQAAAGKFDRLAFERIAQETHDRVVAELPQRPLTLCVDFTAAGDAFARDQMGGVVAMTAGSGKLIVKIHPDANWQALLPYVLAHELQHSYWAQHHFDPKRPFTLADYLVFEGRADNFAMYAFGGHPAPWVDALDAQQLQSTRRRFESMYGDSSQAVLMASMFGDAKSGIPQWAGYTVGYRLVAEKIAEDRLTDWRKISALPAAHFVAKAAPVAAEAAGKP